MFATGSSDSMRSSSQRWKNIVSVNPNWHLAIPKLIITYLAEVENVVFIDPATSTASTAIGTIAAGTTILHPVARMSATAPDATVADIQQPILSLGSITQNYSNVVIFQNNVGELHMLEGFGPAEPANNALSNQIISTGTHLAGLNNIVLVQTGDGAVKLKTKAGPLAPTSHSANQIINAQGIKISAGSETVITQDGSGNIEIRIT